jgi:hypothetical protein
VGNPTDHQVTNTFLSVVFFICCQYAENSVVVLPRLATHQSQSQRLLQGRNVSVGVSKTAT